MAALVLCCLARLRLFLVRDYDRAKLTKHFGELILVLAQINKSTAVCW